METMYRNRYKKLCIDIVYKTGIETMNKTIDKNIYLFYCTHKWNTD